MDIIPQVDKIVKTEYINQYNGVLRNDKTPIYRKFVEFSLSRIGEGVSRLFWEQEAAGSNPAFSTTLIAKLNFICEADVLACIFQREHSALDARGQVIGDTGHEIVQRLCGDVFAACFVLQHVVCVVATG